MKIIKLSVQEFAEPSPRTGSLRLGQGGSPDMEKGIEIHQRVQARRSESNPEYQIEKKISRSFEVGPWSFQVDGRMDGVVPGLFPKIEEIKTSQHMESLFEELQRDPYAHPYGLQLLTYGYFYWLENAALPELIFHLVSTKDNSTQDLSLVLEIEKYEAWLKRRLEELGELALAAQKRFERRKKLVKKLIFPFSSPRPGQTELIQKIDEVFERGKNILLEAPTGLGKTVGVIYPSLKSALARGQQIFYLTPKNSQQEVAEEALEKLRGQGCKVKSLTLTAKTKICMKDEMLCDPSYCEYAKNFYDKFHEKKLQDVLASKKSLSLRTFKKMAQDFEVCPAQLQIEAVPLVDAVIGDYNHVFSRHSSIGSASVFDPGRGKPVLILDEAHNIPSRTQSNYSPVLEGFGELIREHAGEKRTVRLDAAKFVAAEEKLKAELLEQERLDPLKLQKLFAINEFNYVLELASVEGSPFFISYLPEGDGKLKITCCDASAYIRKSYERFGNVIAFSATIRPFEYYAKLSGLEGEKLEVADFISPFDRDKRKILIIPQISTKYSQRDRNYARIAETISRVVKLRPGNYLAFFPSFDFLEKTVALLGFEVLKQTRHMKRTDVDTILGILRQGGTNLLCAVQGGMFSEGIDYPGTMAIGAFIIGPPLPSFDFERENMKAYYEGQYSQGHQYAYTYPAMTKAVQAAGRVIRNEDDQGIIILMDDRFLQDEYSNSMPKDWFNESPRELVSSSILADLGQFWSQF